MEKFSVQYKHIIIKNIQPWDICGKNIQYYWEHALLLYMEPYNCIHNHNIFVWKHDYDYY